MTSATRRITPSNNPDTNALLGNYAWASSTLTYSFPQADSLWSTDFALGYGSVTSRIGEPWQGFVPITADKQEAFQAILATWAAVSGIAFVQVPDSDDGYGMLRIAETRRSSNPLEYAWAYFPSTSERGGDIWINRASPFVNNPWTPGSAAYYTVLHEVGHALGLKHPFGETPTLPTALDALSNTMMSYDAWPGAAQSYFDYYPTTPMRLDIAAIQYLYGPASAPASDTTYRFDDNQPYHQTLWDSGGFDTLIYDGTRDTYLDLRPGQGSYIGQPVHAYAASSNALLGQVPNLWIAFDTVIEAAALGSGNDTLRPHENTRLLDGGAGVDTLLLPGQASDYQLTRTAEGFILRLAAATEPAIQLANIERFQLDTLSYATDLASDQNAGQAVLALHAVAPQYLNDPATAGFVIRALDDGLSLQAFFAQLEADGTLDALFGDMNDQALAAHLAMNLSDGTANASQVAYFEEFAQNAISRTDLLTAATVAPENIIFLNGLSESWGAFPYL